MVPFDGATFGKENEPIPTVDVPAGDSPYGEIAMPTSASTIVQAPGANAVLIANPSDKAVYFYKEGMSAPMGQFNSYGSQPRAVLVIDRSLREKSRPGVYETVGKLEKSGVSDIAFFTNTPRIALSFEILIKEASTDKNALDPHIVNINQLDSTVTKPITVGSTVELRFQLSSHKQSLPSKLNIYTFGSSGSWRKRQTVDVSASGMAIVKVTPPLPGIYQTTLEAPSSLIKMKQTKNFTFEVTAK